ncbi:MAG: L-lactate permease [Planctomycetota bacterium]
MPMWLLAVLPLAVLIVAMVASVPRLRLPLPADRALPLAAVLAYGVQWVWTAEAAAIHARVIEGLLSSLTPLAIVFGAVLLFATLERSGAMAVLTGRLRRMSPDPMAQVLLVGWSLSYLVEGLSGFGTPAAIAAPILVGLGFPAVRVAAACLVMNTVPVVFGAVGMPMWFGLGELGLSDAETGAVARRAAAVQWVTAPVVAAAALSLLFPWRAIVRRWWMVLAVTGATVGGSWVVARFSVEFPSIVGGLCGLAASLVVARFVPGEGESAGDEPPPGGPSLVRSALPLGLTVLLLAVTRIEPLGLRGLLTATEPAAAAGLGVLGTASVSAVGVVGVEGLLGTAIGWSMPLLYVPFILPFVAVSLLSVPLLGMSGSAAAGVWAETVRRLVKPGVALAGALVLVKLMMHGGDGSPVMAVGGALAAAVGAVRAELWPVFAPVLGALGSFFSGSATVSNLTFAPVQDAIAAELGLDRATVLAMQATGAAIGNMVCVHNIVAVAAVLGLLHRGGGDEGGEARGDAAAPLPGAGGPVAAILRLTFGPMLVYAAAAALAVWVLG